jgi:hypothetical protein
MKALQGPASKIGGDIAVGKPILRKQAMESEVKTFKTVNRGYLVAEIDDCVVTVWPR